MDIHNMSYTSVIHYVCILAVIMSSCLTTVAWNMRSFSCATPYIQTLMQAADILLLSEHRLYTSELYMLQNINKDFDYHCSSSHDLSDQNVAVCPGHGGMALCWRKTLSHRIHPVESSSDRILIIEVSQFQDNLSLYIIGVYLPHQACQIANFDDTLALVEKYVNKFKDNGLTLIWGDTNCHFGPEGGKRCWGKTTPNANKLLHMMYRQNMLCVDTMSIASGPNYTFHVKGVGTSYIDHCIASKGCSYIVKECGVINDAIKNTSDHLPVFITLQDKDDNNMALTNPKYHIAWRKSSEDMIYNKYTVPLQDAINKAMTNMLQPDHILKNPDDIDIFLETLTSLMHRCTDNLVKAKPKKCQKRYWNQNLTHLAKKSKSLWRQ